MTIAITGTGGWATRAGLSGRLLNSLNGSLADTATDVAAAWGSGGPTVVALGVMVNLIQAQYASNDQQVIDGIYASRDDARGGLNSFKSDQRKRVQDMFVAVADRDVGLPVKDLPSAVAEVVRQAKNSSDSIKKPTVTVTPASGTPSPTGNPVVTASVVGPTGVQLDCSYNEVLDLVVTADSFSGGATAGRETLSVTGDAAEGDLLSSSWPKGSGASATLNLCDATEDAGSNLLTNGSFDTWNVNTPGTWTIVAGAATITAEASDIYGTTGKALKITSDGATATQLKQEITSLVTARDVLALNAFLHVDGSGTAAGKLRFALVDAGGTVINDDAGTANSYTVDLTQVGWKTTYKATGAATTTELNGAAVAGGAGAIYFRLPSNMPANVFVELKVTTLITNAEPVWVDHVACVKATQAYGSGVAGGPNLAAFSGSTKVVVNDRYKVTVSNAYDGAFQKFLWRALDLPGLNQLFPSSGANTINENLIS